MGTGILLCGLNGAGKSTLGKNLAKRLAFHFIDIEDLYFPKTEPGYMYAVPRTRKEVEALLKAEISAHSDFVLSAVKGDYGEEIYPFFQYAVLIDVPKNIRMRRVRDRSFRKFGDRMLPGGDLYEREEGFFRLVQSRAEDTVEKWLGSLTCPVIRIDGTKTVEENMAFVMEQMGKNP